MLAVIFGLPGVGKSTVVKEVMKKIDIERIHWGHFAEKLAIEKGLIKNIDELRKIEVIKQKSLQFEVIAQIMSVIDTHPHKHYIIETHSALKTQQGYLPGFNAMILDRVRPDIFIVVESDAESIWERRQNDPSRKRDDDLSLFDVKMNLETTRYFASAFAVESGATLAIVENKQGEVEYAANKIVEYIKPYMHSNQ